VDGKNFHLIEVTPKRTLILPVFLIDDLLLSAWLTIFIAYATSFGDQGLIFIVVLITFITFG
jgi:hypothetical protein